MRADVANPGAAFLESVLGWWELAGVDALVEDAPRDWFQAVAPPAADASHAAHAPEIESIPQDIQSLAAWLMAPENLPGLGPNRLAPAGTPASGVMILTDMPDPDDQSAGVLLSGSAGRLFDRMLAAIGREREAVYVASLAPARPPGGITDSALEAELAEIARQHVALAAPRAVLLMGDATTRALIGTNLVKARGTRHVLNHKGGTLSAIATFHPRFLLSQPARKAEAWADLRLFLECLET